MSDEPNTFLNGQKTPLHRDWSLIPECLFDYGFEIKTTKMLYCKKNL
jgi:hypothetical protein